MQGDISLCNFGFYEEQRELIMSDADAAGIDLASGIAAFESKEFSSAAGLLGPLAEGGDLEAQYRMAIMCQNGLGMVINEPRARKYMLNAAESGMALAQHGVGFMYMIGECLEKDGTKAIGWFEKAAEQGLQGSLTTMALMYEQGDGVEKDTEKAAALYKQAGF